MSGHDFKTNGKVDLPSLALKSKRVPDLSPSPEKLLQNARVMLQHVCRCAQIPRLGGLPFALAG